MHCHSNLFLTGDHYRLIMEKFGIKEIAISYSQLTQIDGSRLFCFAIDIGGC